MTSSGIETKWLNLIRSKGYTVTKLSKELNITYKQLFELAIGKSLETMTWDKFVELCKMLDISAIEEGIPMFDEDHKKFESLHTGTQISEGDSPIDKLREVMNDKGFKTQRELAHSLDMEYTQLNKYFTGTSLPSPYTIIQISKALDISVTTCDSLFSEAYKFRHNGKMPIRRNSDDKPNKKYKCFKSEASKVQSEPIAEQDIKESLLLEPILFLQSIHTKEPYEWNKYFYIPSEYQDSVYDAINTYMKRYTTADSITISKVIYDCINNQPDATKFSDMNYRDQGIYLFHRLVHSGAAVSTIGIYFQALDAVYTSYTPEHLLDALGKMFRDCHSITFEMYSIIHNTITTIVEEIRKET